MVDDGGKFTSMRTDGSDLRVPSDILGKDPEAIASTGDGFLYIGLERPPEIVERYAGNLQETGRSWELYDLPVSGSKGMEGLTWVPNGAHPYGTRPSGGVFYASSQLTGRVYVYEINRSSSGQFSPPILLNPLGFVPLPGAGTDISDLYFSPSHGILYVLYDTANFLVAVDILNSNNELAVYHLPTTPTEQEGITLLPGNCDSPTTIYLTDDKTGRIHSFNDFQAVCN